MRLLGFLVFLFAVGATGAVGEEKGAVATPTRIKGAVSRGAIWLKKSQREDGSWGPCVATGEYGRERIENRSAEGFADDEMNRKVAWFEGKG